MSDYLTENRAWWRRRYMKYLGVPKAEWEQIMRDYAEEVVTAERTEPDYSAIRDAVYEGDDE